MENNKNLVNEQNGKAKENWYLPYMNQKTKGEDVEEKQSPVAIFYCAGASNVGQATMLSAVKAANEVGYDKAALLCLASISGELKNVTNAAKESKAVIAVDGCPMSCAKKTLEMKNISVDKDLILTKDLKISKNFDLNSSVDLELIKDAVVSEVNKFY
ncbi:putative zinc-binding protein [Romboutsia sedimentorum]|uniref:Zinc-binding protein n=1 Tax=Romboutsia sedimentorum TaxID=1368474 RepID=A0ABT7E7P3_9FIRM|nr:putative zinc-binding protein [Romboutsia sedimentorum]MDK2562088.1 putative zinc-binding protein [Romboutsia sedimentorum]